MGGNPDRLVLIGIARDQVEANIWRDVLEKDGIPVFIKDTGPLSPFGPGALPGGLQVFAGPQDEKRARWLLGETAGETPGPEG
jgi:hypothetical protein